MPYSIDNQRQSTWTDPGGVTWNLRWKKKAEAIWNYYPIVLTSAAARWGVVVTGDPYPTSATYVGILLLGNRYQVSIQTICGGPTGNSPWSAPIDFDTFLTCPVVTSAPTITSIALNTIQVGFTYNKKGSLIYPITNCRWKKSTDMVWTYSPLPADGSHLHLVLPGPGTYTFIIDSQCTDTSGIISSPATIYVY